MTEPIIIAQAPDSDGTKRWVRGTLRNGRFARVMENSREELPVLLAEVCEEARQHWSKSWWAPQVIVTNRIADTITDAEEVQKEGGEYPPIYVRSSAEGEPPSWSAVSISTLKVVGGPYPGGSIFDVLRVRGLSARAETDSAGYLKGCARFVTPFQIQPGHHVRDYVQPEPEEVASAPAPVAPTSGEARTEYSAKDKWRVVDAGGKVVKKGFASAEEAEAALANHLKQAEAA